MGSKRASFRSRILSVLIVNGCGLAVAQPSAAPWTPNIPKVWDDGAVASMEIPLAYAPGSPVHVPSEYYYRMKVRTIYRSYPFYHPSKEPPGLLGMAAKTGTGDHLRRLPFAHKGGLDQGW